MVARPQVVRELTDRKSESMYETCVLPFDANRMTENINGVKVLQGIKREL